MTPDDLDTQITDTRAILTALSAAILALADPTVRDYRLDTGQGEQEVRRNDLPFLIRSRQALQAELADLCARKGGGSRQVVPLW